MQRPRGRAVRHEPLWHKLWLLLRMAEPDAYTRVVCRTDFIGSCLRKLWRRVLLVKRFVRGHRRARLLHRNEPQRHANAQHLRLLRQASVTYADSATDSRAERGSHVSSNEVSDEHADIGTDFIAVI